MQISIIDAFSKAVDWTGEVLFKPFEPGKWLVLGFCAWLAQLADGGGGSTNWNVPDGSDFGRVGQADDWVRDNLPFFVAAALIIFFVVLAVVVVALWISSRGKFMFLDGVVRNQAAVVEPWSRFRAEGNSLFLFRLLMLIGALIAFGLLAAMLVTLLWGNFANEQFDAPAIAVLAAGIAVAIVMAFGLGLFLMIVNDFVVPVMYLRRCTVGPALLEVRGLIGWQPGTVILYVLFKIVIAVVVVMISVFAIFCTCCLVIIPYVGTVILLPIHVFLRSFPLFFLGQFGPDYKRFLTLGPDADEVAEVFT